LGQGEFLEKDNEKFPEELPKSEREQSQRHEGLQGQLGQGKFLEKDNEKFPEEFAKSEK
jgi:hypothetical protein